jgi:hypothetical protein
VSLVGFKARNHRQQVLLRGPNVKVDDRATTPEVFDPLEDRFGFTVDVAASERNRKVDRFYSIEDDGLAQSWAGERVWCNPPYSNIGEWCGCDERDRSTPCRDLVRDLDSERAGDLRRRLREQVNSGRTGRESAEGLPEGTLPRV